MKFSRLHVVWERVNDAIIAPGGGGDTKWAQVIL
jgi:hypothetical protein